MSSQKLLTNLLTNSEEKLTDDERATEHLLNIFFYQHGKLELWIFAR